MSEWLRLEYQAASASTMEPRLQSLQLEHSQTRQPTLLPCAADGTVIAAPFTVVALLTAVPTWRTEVRPLLLLILRPQSSH